MDGQAITISFGVALQKGSQGFFLSRYRGAQRSLCALLKSVHRGWEAPGVVHTHASLQAQMDSMEEAWGWGCEDRILHALPLHHMHGIANALLTAHYCGACVEFLPRFSPSLVWQHLMVHLLAAPPGLPCFHSFSPAEVCMSQIPV